MKLLKKIGIGILFSIFGFAMFAPSATFAGKPNIGPKNNKFITTGHTAGTEDVGVIGTKKDGVDQATGDALINVIKSVINRVLGFLGLIALIIVLYAGFLMLISMGDDEKYSKGWKILKNALIGLVVIGISWLLVTLAFWFVGQVTGDTTTNEVAIRKCVVFNGDGDCTDRQEGVGVIGADGSISDISEVGGSLINVVKSVINWILGILGLIVLVIVLYAGFTMLFSFGDDEKFNKGWKILKTAFIALIVIGLAWFIVTMIFWVIGKVSGSGGESGEVVEVCNLYADDGTTCLEYTSGVGLIGTDENVGDGLISVIKNIINWVLGILALIALIIVLYGGFLMLTSMGEEDKYKKGWTILKYAAIGLILIGIAWFIVSMIFWLINLTAKDAGPANTGGSGDGGSGGGD